MTPMVSPPIMVHRAALTALDVFPSRCIVNVFIFVQVIIGGDFLLNMFIFDTASSMRLAMVLRYMNLASRVSNFSQVVLSTIFLNLMSPNLRRERHSICSPSSHLLFYLECSCERLGRERYDIVGRCGVRCLYSNCWCLRFLPSRLWLVRLQGSRNFQSLSLSSFLGSFFTLMITKRVMGLMKDRMWWISMRPPELVPSMLNLDKSFMIRQRASTVSEFRTHCATIMELIQTWLVYWLLCGAGQ